MPLPLDKSSQKALIAVNSWTANTADKWEGQIVTLKVIGAGVGRTGT